MKCDAFSAIGAIISHKVAKKWFMLLLVSLTASAAGDSLAGSQKPVAEALFRQGREAYKAADYEAACGYFAESQRLDPAPGTLLNLAFCQDKRGKLSAAWEHVRAAMQQLSASDPRMPAARKLWRSLDRRVPRLTVRLDPTSPKGTVVQLDGVELRGPAFGVALPVDPGRHVVVVDAAGRQARRVAMRLRPAERRSLIVAAGPPQRADNGMSMAPKQPPGRTGQPRDEGPSAGRWLGYGLLTAGVGGLATSAVMAGLVLSESATVDAHCDEARRCDDTGVQAAEDGDRFSTIGTVSFVGGLVALGGGLYFTLRPEGGSAAISLRSLWLPGGYGAGVSGVF